MPETKSTDTRERVNVNVADIPWDQYVRVCFTPKDDWEIFRERISKLTETLSAAIPKDTNVIEVGAAALYLAAQTYNVLMRDEESKGPLEEAISAAFAIDAIQGLSELFQSTRNAAVDAQTKDDLASASSKSAQKEGTG